VLRFLKWAKNNLLMIKGGITAKALMKNLQAFPNFPG